MKKVLPILVLGGLLITLFVPLAVSAQPEQIPDTCTLQNDLSNVHSECVKGKEVNVDDYGICCMLNTIMSATNWFFYILIIISVIMIIYGGFSILFATGDPDKMKKGKGVIIYAMVGIAIALFAKVIPSIVRFIMGL